MPAPPVPNSATGGFITPVAPDPLYGDALEDLFHDTVVGILGTAITNPNLVRPRWQAKTPNMPDFDVGWVAFGIVDAKKDWDPYMNHDPAYYSGNGNTTSEQDEEFVVLFSFYGPNAYALQSLFEDGLKIDQNRSLLQAQGIKWMSAAGSHQIPALLKERWVKRVDQRMTFRRRVYRNYAILNITSASVDIDNEHYITHVTVPPPPPPP